VEFEGELDEVLEEIREMLLEKNQKYGDSALNPVRIFSKASTKEQLFVRMDDKLSRIARGDDEEDEDVPKDLAGYLVMYMIHRNRQGGGE